MQDPTRLEDLTPEQIKSALSAKTSGLTDDQVLAIRDFVWRVGGIQNARLAVDMLIAIKRAA